MEVRPVFPTFASDRYHHFLEDRDCELAVLYHLLLGASCVCFEEDILCTYCARVLKDKKLIFLAPLPLLRHWAEQESFVAYLKQDSCDESLQLLQALEKDEPTELMLSLKTLYFGFYLGDLETYEINNHLPAYASHQGVTLCRNFKSTYGLYPNY